MFILDVIVDFLRMIIILFTGKKPIEMEESNKLKIFVKCGSDTVVPVYLETDWTVFDLKEAIASKLCLKTEELRIIFAGKELHDKIKMQVHT